MSLFSILGVGTRGLTASQLAMDVTSQNISNANVAGYSRKRLNQAADYKPDGTYGQIGIGVDVISIERMRNTFIDDQIRRQNQEMGVFQEYDNTLNGIEKSFNEPSDTGLLHTMNQFFDSWQNLANNPSDLAARTAVQTNSTSLIDQFHSIDGELQNLRQTCNDQLSQRVAKVNELSEKIFNLNTAIGAVEISPNKKANDSRDQRDELVKELSTLTNIEVTENERGQITITTEGNILVSPLDFQKLETTTQTYSRPDGTQYADVGIRFANSRKQYNPQKGQIKGLLDSRDIIIPGYQTKLDELAKSLVSKVNELHKQGYSLTGVGGLPFFDENVTGASDIKLSASVLSDVRNIAAASGGAPFPAVANVLAAGTHNFGIAPLQLYRDPAAAPPVPAHNIVQGTVAVTNGAVMLKEDVDYHIDYTTGTIQMLHAGYDAANLTVNFQYRTAGFNGPGDNANALAIAALRDQPTMSPDALSNPTVSFTEYYSSVVGQVGNDANAAKSSLDTRDFLVKQYQADQDAVAGVSLDEEMSNMIQYQHTYQAAAHLISVADKMLDVLMNI
jgi:flagellar hook-associated protein 1 FlgK